MREYVRRGACLCLAALLVVWGAGCRTSTRSGLPGHVASVEVHVFRNNTMYHGIEGAVTRSVIDRIHADPRVRVAGRNGDALLTGEITKVTRETLRETTTNEAGTVQITLEISYSLYDNVNRRYLIEDAVVRSTDAGSGHGIYEASRGEAYEVGVADAARAAAAEIVRRTIGMW